MKVVLTLLVRDEADIVDANLAFHLAAGVDFVIATDHRSRDGTTEILESYEQRGVLRLFREDGEFSRQAEWQTRMARLAATEHGADWVINSDADEFWWPRDASLTKALQAVPDAYGVVRGLTRNFVPLEDDSGWFADRMTVRFAGGAPINDPATPFRPVVKVAHRGHPNVRVGNGGCHQVFGVPWPVLPGWYPFEVLHLPLRSREQSAGKYRKTWTGWADNLRGDLARAKQHAERGRPDAVWERAAVGGRSLERGLADGALIVDTRLRDALRALRAGASGSPGVEKLTFPLPSRSDLVAHSLQTIVFDEAETVRSQRWVDELWARVRSLEGSDRAGRSA
jgi:hypothetical protein